MESANTEHESQFADHFAAVGVSRGRVVTLHQECPWSTYEANPANNDNQVRPGKVSGEVGGPSDLQRPHLPSRRVSVVGPGADSVERCLESVQVNWG